MVLRRAEDVLPHWLGKREAQWIVWAYAVFQLLRKNALFLWIISYPVWLLRYTWRGLIHGGKQTYIVALVPTALRGQFGYQSNGIEGDSYLSKNSPETFEISDRGSGGSWPSEWRFVKFNFHSGCQTDNSCRPTTLKKMALSIISLWCGKAGQWHYITTKSAIDTMAQWVFECDGNERNVVFVHWAEVSAVAEEVSREAAYENILSGSYSVHVEADNWLPYPLPSVLRYAAMNARVWGVLSTIPVLLQAWGHNKASTLISLLIILLDFLRGLINHVYVRVYLKFRLVFKRVLDRYASNDESPSVMLLFSVLLHLLGKRWIPKHPRNRYIAKQNEEMIVYPFCKIKILPDEIGLLSTGYLTYSSIEADQDENTSKFDPRHHFLARLWERHAIRVLDFLPITRVQYAKVSLENDLVIE